MPTAADNMIVKVQSTKVYDDKEFQRLEMDGRFGEKLGGSGGAHAVPRIQNYGFTNHPPKGSQGVTTTLGGNPTNAMVIGMEHAQYRPKNLAEGEFKTYEKWGGYMHGKSDMWETKVGTAIMHVKRDGTIHLNPPAALLMEEQVMGKHIVALPFTDRNNRAWNVGEEYDEKDEGLLQAAISGGLVTEGASREPVPPTTPPPSEPPPVDQAPSAPPPPPPAEPEPDPTSQP